MKAKFSPRHESYARLNEGAQALVNAMILQHGRERTAKMLGTGDNTLDNLASGGFVKPSTRDRIQAKLVEIAKGVAA